MEHHFKVEEAKEYGIECAILLYNIRYWIEKNKANGKHFHDGHYWTYNSGVAFARLFPYLTSTQISRHLRNLESIGVLISGNYNNVAYDKTKWYAIAEKPCSNLNNDASKMNKDDSEMNNGEFESEQPIPDSKKDRKTDRKDSENFPPSPSNVSNTDGTKKPSSEHSGESEHSKTNGVGDVRNLQPSTPQPPIGKIAEQMLTTLRQKTSKAVMEEILAASDLDLPTLAKMFAEYWVFEKGRPFVSKDWKGLVASFEAWAKVAKSKEIPAKESMEGLHSNDRMAKLIPAIEKRKIIKLTPQDAQKVNAFIREFNPSDWALYDGTQSFFDGNGREWDHWIKAVNGAIGREQMGEL